MKFERGQLVNTHSNPEVRGLVIKNMDPGGNVYVYFFRDMSKEWVFHIHLRKMVTHNNV